MTAPRPEEPGLQLLSHTQAETAGLCNQKGVTRYRVRRMFIRMVLHPTARQKYGLSLAMLFLDDDRMRQTTARDVYQLGITTSGTPFHRNVCLALR